MASRKRRKFTSQFKADAVRLVTTGAKPIAAVTEEFDLTETALRAWVKRAEADEGKGTGETLTTAGPNDRARGVRHPTHAEGAHADERAASSRCDCRNRCDRDA